MDRKSDWFPLPKRDAAFLIILALVVIISFLPWSYDLKFMNITILAWIAGVLHILVPLSVIMLILSEKPKDQTAAQTNSQGKPFS